ncbi:hypothetical protein [Streptomyces cinereoruber]
MSSPLPVGKPTASADSPPQKAACGRLGGAEAAVVITVITAVTALSILERPVPVLLTVLAATAGGRL